MTPEAPIDWLSVWGVAVPYLVITVGLWLIITRAARVALAEGLLAQAWPLLRGPGVDTRWIVDVGTTLVLAFIPLCAAHRVAMATHSHALGATLLVWLAVASVGSVLIVVSTGHWVYRIIRHVLFGAARAARADGDARANAARFVAMGNPYGLQIAAYDIDAARYLAATDAVRAIYGEGEPGSPGSITGRCYYDFLHPGDVARATAVAAARSAHIDSGEADPGYHGLILRLWNGRWIEFHQDEREGSVVGVATILDVTAREMARAAAERTAAEREHELRTLRIQADIKNLLPPRDHG